MYFPILKSIATKEVVTTHRDATMIDVLHTMQRNNHRMIVVVESGKYYILTIKEILAFLQKNQNLHKSLREFELDELPLLDENENLLVAQHILKNRKREYMGLIDENGNLSGLVTNSDIIASIDPKIIMENLPISILFKHLNNFRYMHKGEKIFNACKIFSQESIECVIVVDDEQNPLGIVTPKDFLKVFQNEANMNKKIADFMSSPLKYIYESATIKEALEFSRKNHFKHIVVVDKNTRIVGIVTQKDLIANTYLKWSEFIDAYTDKLEKLVNSLKNKNEQLEEIIFIDELTKIYNRRYFTQLLEKELSYAKRYNGTFTVLFADVDDFKKINDMYGHEVGDEVLREVANIVQKHLRKYDVVARWGGEEFVVLLPNTSLQQAYQVAEKLKDAINHHDFQKVGNITMSFGIAQNEKDDTPSSLLQRADMAMYRAKKMGKNMVCS